MRSASPARRGFTLIELLIAITILAMMTGIVYASFVSVTDTTDIARANAAELRFRQFLWSNFSENLASVYSDPGCVEPDFQFAGEDSQGAWGAADSLHFVTSLPMPGAKALPGILRVVSYSIADENETEGEGVVGATSIDAAFQDGAQGSMLVIEETPLILSPVDFGAKEQEVGMEPRVRKVPVQSFNVVYFDGRKDEWVDSWDSSSENRLPWAVRIMVNFARTEDERFAEYNRGIDPNEEPDLDMIVSLPLGRGAEEQLLHKNYARGASGGDFGFNPFESAPTGMEGLPQ